MNCTGWYNPPGLCSLPLMLVFSWIVFTLILPLKMKDSAMELTTLGHSHYNPGSEHPHRQSPQCRYWAAKTVGVLNRIVAFTIITIALLSQFSWTWDYIFIFIIIKVLSAATVRLKLKETTIELSPKLDNAGAHCVLDKHRETSRWKITRGSKIIEYHFNALTGNQNISSLTFFARRPPSGVIMRLWVKI